MGYLPLALVFGVAHCVGNLISVFRVLFASNGKIFILAGGAGHWDIDL